MVLLRQVDRPGAQASWTEQLYDRPYKIVNGEVEVENPNHINLLKGRGFKEVIRDENGNEPPKGTALGVIRYGNVEPDAQTEDEDNVSDDKAEVKAEAVVAETPSPSQEDSNVVTAELPPRAKRRGRPKKQQGDN